MPHIERTDQGEQYVIPGTERRTAPGLPYAAEADGQLTLHFYAPPDKTERRNRPTPVRALANGTVLAGGTTAAGAAALDGAATGTAAPAAVEPSGHGLFGRRLAHFPQVFDQP
ncbi:hypothetical protein [Azospirillum sp. TSO35-2]|uniref:hypothetical protein n=1 Tax=Azospirillum sp. TSO35-2 TaxID=716796 RepID=UPI000D61E19A|nr:hypothetical protein [Azospirillum sp. TSO35-2]PWC38970.1 hypothetical protein TSO352_01575 [Azospirillum sp. TSO35-2]